MGSVLEKPNLNKIFLIYGNLDDMFISKDLQKNNFRVYLNSYLKELGYKQIVYYSGAKNVGKYVLDDESATYAITKNRQKNNSNTEQAQQSDGESNKPQKRRHRILNPQANAKYEPNKTQQTNTQSDSQADTQPNTQTQNKQQNTQSVSNSQSETHQQVQKTQNEKQKKNTNSKKTKKLIYKQPKITPAEFLDDAKKMMKDASIKTAVVFTFIQDFLTDRSAPLQPYMELLSHLWGEYSVNGNENICIFLAPQMSSDDLKKLFEENENGEIFKNRFFNDDDSINRGCTINIGLPNSDEVTLMLEYLRII
ncbi:MAG: hypothetical protein ACI4GV_05605, partial [Acutalibacteraceae bacterium]